jgi:hypothetical protein
VEEAKRGMTRARRRGAGSIMRRGWDGPVDMERTEVECFLEIEVRYLNFKFLMELLKI